MPYRSRDAHIFAKIDCIRSITNAGDSVIDDLPITDAHHHLWDLQAVRYPWLQEGGERFFGDPEPIRRNYLLEDLRRDIGDLPVTRSVHVQVGAHPEDTVAETRWLQSVADDSGGMPNAIVAFCDLAADEAPAVLDAQLEFPDVRGIRQIVGRSAKEDAATGSGELLANPDWRRNLARLPALGLSFDLQLVPPQMPAAIGVLEELPELRVALCHCGSPRDRSEEGMAFWRRQMRRLAGLPNVYCKLSGFGMFDHDWDTASVREIVLHAIDVFGPRRCMFGSNFPVDKLYKDYATVFAHYRELIGGFDTGAQRAMLSGTARAFYRI